ncbi:MAG: DUF885 domain-containing protein [Myxococcota bacterium]
MGGCTCGGARVVRRCACSPVRHLATWPTSGTHHTGRRALRGLMILFVVLAIAATPAPAPVSRPAPEPSAPGLDGPALVPMLNAWKRRPQIQWSSVTDTASYDAEQTRVLDSLATVRADVEGLSGLTPHDALVAHRLLLEIRTAALQAECGAERWHLEPFDPLAGLFRADGTVDRLAISPAIERFAKAQQDYGVRTQLMRDAVSRGVVDHRGAVEAYIRQSRALQIPPLADLDVTNRDRLSAALGAYIEVRSRFANFLEVEVLPSATTKPHIPEACYQASILAHTDLDVSADALHTRGLEELATIESEIAALGSAIFGTDDLVRIREELRAPRHHFASVDTLLAEASRHAEEGWEGSRAWIPGEVPRCRVRIRRDAGRAGAWTPSGQYDGGTITLWGKPGVLRTWDLRTIVFHECAPGHHIERILSGTTAGWPSFMHRNASTAIVEGWAHYSEWRAAERGLFPDPFDRIGMLEHRAWRAARLVVDTGLHHQGWSRERAEDFLYAHTALDRAYVVEEVERYLRMPGQALAYKVGELEIQRLAARAVTELGDDFDLVGFHRAVLGNAGIPLGALEGRVDAWIREVRGN